MSSLTGEIRETDEGGFEGWLATPTFDLEIVLVSNKDRKAVGYPDYDVFTESPAGRQVLIGGAWERVDPARREYLAMVLDITGREEDVGAYPKFNKMKPNVDRVYELIPHRKRYA